MSDPPSDRTRRRVCYKSAMVDHARRLAGEVLTTGIPGPAIDAETRRLLERLGPSGVILFRRNVESVDQLRDLTAELHALPSRPFVSIDHEGGRVVRLGPPFTSFPSARDVARAGDATLARAVGRAMGIELQSVGIDIDFAPVLDVDSNPRNPVIGDRAFGATAHDVCTLALAFHEGLRAEGVIGCGKHFPGHGDTGVDSHIDLPVVKRNRAALEAVELAPFRAAIAAQVPMLMTAHVRYPALDPELPATLSPRILSDLLRADLGFTGVVVSDDLEMGALRSFGAVPDLAVAALGAGADWVLICNDLEASMRAGERIATAIERRELDEDAVAQSARRVRGLRQKQATGPPCVLPVAQHLDLASEIDNRLAQLASQAAPDNGPLTGRA